MKLWSDSTSNHKYFPSCCTRRFFFQYSAKTIGNIIIRQETIVSSSSAAVPIYSKHYQHFQHRSWLKSTAMVNRMNKYSPEYLAKYFWHQLFYRLSRPTPSVYNLIIAPVLYILSTFSRYYTAFSSIHYPGWGFHNACGKYFMWNPLFPLFILKSCPPKIDV